MPTVIFPGPEGRLEGRFSPAPRPRAPVAMILHPHPQGGGTMNEQMTQRLYKTFVNRGFATLRFNFRGVGRSQGSFDNGVGELSDAASALDWVQPQADESFLDLGAGHGPRIVRLDTFSFEDTVARSTAHLREAEHA